MNDHKMIRANLNPDVDIKERDKNAYHFRWVMVRINPADPTHPVRKTEVRAIRKCDYRAFFEGKTTEQLIRRMKIIGAEDVELVHDPTKPIITSEKVNVFSKVEVKEVTDEQKIKESRESELAYKEARAGLSPALNSAEKMAAVQKRVRKPKQMQP
jgi:hypothetical protein